MYRWRRKKCVKNKPRWSDHITFNHCMWSYQNLCNNLISRLPLPKLTRPAAVRSKTFFSGEKIDSILDNVRNVNDENTKWFKTKGECRTIYHLVHTYFENLIQKRFGDIRNLTFAIPEKSWMYSFKESFHHSMIRWHTTFDLRNLTHDF